MNGNYGKWSLWYNLWAENNNQVQDEMERKYIWKDQFDTTCEPGRLRTIDQKNSFLEALNRDKHSTDLDKPQTNTKKGLNFFG